MGQENNSITVTTGNNGKLRTMTRTVVTGTLDTIDALHQYLPPFDMGGNTVAVEAARSFRTTPGHRHPLPPRTRSAQTPILK
jgi:hypothetical protein